MGEEDSVDVVIPNYQETDLLLRAVNSALSQGSMLGTIFVVDDGSKKETRAYIREHIETKLNVKVLFTEHASHPGIARNIGLAQCTSEWVAFLDSDDVWEIDKLKKQILFAKSFNLDFVSSNALIQDSSALQRTYFSHDSNISLNSRSLTLDNLVINSTVIVRLSQMVTIGGYVHEYHLRGVEDYSTWLRLSTICKMGYLDNPLTTYTVSESSFSRNQNPILHLFALIDFFYWIKSKRLLLLRIFLLRKILRYLFRRETWRGN